MNLRHIFPVAIAITITTFALPRQASAQPAGVIVLANTNQPVTGTTGETYGARIPVTVGFNQGGYNLTGFSMSFADNSAADFSNVTITLYSANSPGNLDYMVSTMNVPTPHEAGLYTFEWTTNVYLPPQMTDFAPTYYIFFIAPTFQIGSTQSLYIDYTTSTNYIFNDSWTFYPESTTVNGSYGYIPLFDIYATILPPPKLYPIKLTNEVVLADKSFQFGFTNSANLDFTVYATTNAKLAFTNWLMAGNPDYLGTNYYQYNSGAGLVTNATFSRLYFRVTSP
jgi:hypothetical protein